MKRRDGGEIQSAKILLAWTRTPSAVTKSVTTCLASPGNFSSAMMSSLMYNLGLTLVSVVKDNVKKYLVYSSSLLMITQPPRLEDTTNICAD